VKLIESERIRGFGGGSNLGIQAARNRIAVLLNNDMRVTPGFLRPLLEGFTDEAVFAVTAQIFFRDPNRRREETGLTSGCFEKGFLRVRHEIDSDITTPYPTFYAGGGSTAYDREKFLEMGGFDPLFEPFYLEDTDLSYGAWRRGWKVLYQPSSHLYHEHRATIGKHYSPEAIRAYLHKNYVLMVWKNIHRWRWLPTHLFYLYCHMALSGMGRKTETRTTMGAFLLALRALPQALRCRSRALERAVVDDRAVFARTRPSVFRDVFQSCGRKDLVAGNAPQPASSGPEPPPSRPLNILFVSPYSIYPPIHGGAVFMLEAIRELAKRNNLYVLTFVDHPEEAKANRSLEQVARKVEAYVRRPKPGRHFALRSHAQETFWDPSFAALLDKFVYLYDIDVIQFEYTQLAQYRLPLEHTPQCLFEHDVYFRSVARQMLSRPGGFLLKAQEFLEWLRAMRFEIGAAGMFDAIFTCHEEEQRLLESLLNGRRPPVISGLRAVIDVSSHSFPGGPRRPDSLLFVGNFQHRPNVDGLKYFCSQVLPLIRARRPTVTFTVVGAHATPEIQRMWSGEEIRWLGQVPDIREPLSQHAVFVCPILAGAGMRVKILEAFASGIPVVSTPLGAEGISVQQGVHLMLAASPEEFAAATLDLLQNPEAASAMARNARQLVEASYDWPAAALELERIYRQLLASKSGASGPSVQRS
jgi:GT2 family glycosyltransferase